MESAIEGDINETTNKLEKVSIDDIQSRHRKERKELQAKIQALKKNAPKSDKKKRKDVLEEIAKLESDLEKKHKQEIQHAEQELKKTEQDEMATKEPAKSIHNNQTNNLDDEENEDNDTQPQQRVSKAQKRRDKKAREAREREEEIKVYAAEAMHAPKALEARKMQSKLEERELVLYNIPSDGDCLYNAIRHQLLQHGLASLTIKELRSETANYIQANKDSLIPYMTQSESGDLLSDEEFQKYCDDVRLTPAWGGQIELKALSSILKVPIEVLQADGSPTVQGSEFGGYPLVITYHRHMYSLGEHYNSTIPLADAPPNDEDNNENGGN